MKFEQLKKRIKQYPVLKKRIFVDCEKYMILVFENKMDDEYYYPFIDAIKRVEGICAYRNSFGMDHTLVMLRNED